MCALCRPLTTTTTTTTTPTTREVDRIFEEFNETSKPEFKDDVIDYVEWSNGLEPQTMWQMARKCRNKGPFAASVLGEEVRLKAKQTLLVVVVVV